MKRRDLIKGLPLFPLMGSITGGLLSPGLLFAAQKTPRPDTPDYFEELGVTRVINAAATMTYLSGSLMLPEVLEALTATAHDFANMHELQDKAGAKIAEMLHCEAAMVTSGAACALVLGTAAAITGTDENKRKQIPNLPGPRPEVIMQKKHRYVFDQAITTTGAKIVEVENAEEMEKAINERTVMTLFFNAAVSWYGGKDSIGHEEFIAISKRHNIPSFIDAAADVPPVENLFKYQKMGFDLVTFSGGKMIRGPQSAGLLFGRKDLIEAAKLNHSPHEAPIGRPMKVNKEEIFGMYAALKAYLERDHKKEWQDWLNRISSIRNIIEDVPGLTTQVHVPAGPANVLPALDVFWEEDKIKISPKEIYEKLKSGQPSIMTSLATRNDKEILNVGVALLKPEQVNIVANRIKEILQTA
ncbi:aminotransferase class V-fold PLP-dependent enzyme [Sinomicrobium weinanense]|uniref:Aminotransferase class V-fold PLP-dependent enzyme n=1 Tax=Sinomicrobium weinanense TaxID=2842200 RepID=A0A926Q4E9_9FLAO|nr:aminotransferase class V-fold PLP-dependent enzyme [Sinomicrobium weinanense]MBC9796810.1 aminotransferase class V-fold PLP-dependent enzyme [Sinomicrobium weinanense]MBU3123686.1 aminotransferase class V-fold PLP-dependent enzyme [Sinomicrobium weinanense]